VFDITDPCRRERKEIERLEKKFEAVVGIAFRSLSPFLANQLM